MNPFDLRGPEFLLFYVGLSALVLTSVWWLRQRSEAGPTPQVHLDDPYFVAFLRAGVNEVFRDAIVILLDRGKLTASEGSVRCANEAKSECTHPVEQEILSFFTSSHLAYDALQPGTLGSSTLAYQSKAEQLELLPDARVRGQRYVRYGFAAVGLAGVAFIKILVALARGRTNIAFLIILSVLVQAALLKIATPRLTAKGKALLRDVESLFSDLQARRPHLRPNAGTKEIAWLVSVFGLTALPAAGFPDVKTLFPKSASGVSLGGSCSSCGAASSCGSGCGGGGCGGGCGGCGGH